MKKFNTVFLREFPDLRLIEESENYSSFYFKKEEEEEDEHYFFTIIDVSHVNENMIHKFKKQKYNGQVFVDINKFISTRKFYIIESKNLKEYKYLFNKKYNFMGQGGSSIIFETPNKNILKIFKGDENSTGRFEDELHFLNKLKDVEGVIKQVSETENFEDKHKNKVLFLEKGENSLNFMKSLSFFCKIEKFLELINTLKDIHGTGIFHLDIKPENIVYHQDRLKFIDFGIAYSQNMSEKNINKRDFNNLGAKFTIAPEMKRNPFYQISEKADIYSLAKTLWIYLTNDKNCFEGEYSKYSRKFGLKYKENEKGIILPQTEYNINYKYLDNILTKCTNENPQMRPSLDILEENLKYFLNSKNKNLNKKQEYKNQSFQQILEILTEKFPPNKSKYKYIHNKKISECSIEEELEKEIEYTYVEWTDDEINWGNENENENRNSFLNIIHELICFLIRYKANIEMINNLGDSILIDDKIPENIKEKFIFSRKILFQSNQFELGEYIFK